MFVKCVLVNSKLRGVKLGLGLGRSANASEASVSATSAKQPTGDRVHPTAACFAI